MPKNLAIVLAAGKGSRMKSNIPKPLHLLNGKTMIYTLVEKLSKSKKFEKILVVVGVDGKEIIENLDEFKSNIVYIIQREQLGTGHAVKCCEYYLKDYPNYRSLILFADCPLLSINTLEMILKNEDDCLACICEKENPTGSGRIILNTDGSILNSIEEKDCSDEQRKIKLTNVGIYLIKNSFINNYIGQVKNNNIQKEYYLPDLILILIREGIFVKPLILKNQDELLNINTQMDLKKANGIRFF